MYYVYCVLCIYYVYYAQYKNLAPDAAKCHHLQVQECHFVTCFYLCITVTFSIYPWFVTLLLYFQKGLCMARDIPVDS